MAKVPIMPSVDEFSEATTVRLGGKLGFARLGPVLSRDRLVMVDMNLVAWWSIPENQTDKKLRATLRLMQACSEWAQTHQTNQGASRTGAQRMVGVEALVGECKKWLAVLYTRGNKLQAIGADYKAERNAYKNAKNIGQKINPIGGSFIHKVLEDQGLLNGPLGPTLSKKMDQMTPADFQLIASTLLPDDTSGARTLYMDSGDRDAYLLTIRGGVVCEADGSPIAKSVAYAMDKYGSLFGVDWKAAYNWGNGQKPTGFFNHSSFMSGKDVICAGTIEKIEGVDALGPGKPFDGQWAVTTDSGHYKPTGDNLKNCLKSLHASGLDLKQYVAKVSFPPPASFFKANEFIRG